MTTSSLHRACRQAFRAMCQYDAKYLAYQDPTADQQVEYAHLEATYHALQRAVDDQAIAAYEAAWQPTR